MLIHRFTTREMSRLLLVAAVFATACVPGSMSGDDEQLEGCRGLGRCPMAPDAAMPPQAVPDASPTQPPSNGTKECRVSNRETWALGGTDCKAGTVIAMGSAQFRCTKPLSEYGPLPIKVVWDFAANRNPDWGDQGPLDLAAGCRGDNDPDTIDLIAYIPGDGKTFGPSGGAAKFRAPPGPVNVQVTGVFQCGPLAPGSAAHQDVWQFQTGNSTGNLAIVNGVSGDWQAGTATCIGAGGAAFWSNQNDVDIYGGRYVTCNHGFLGGGQTASGNVVVGAGFRTGRTESAASGGDARCNGYAASNPCLNTSPFTFTGVVCERWNAASNAWQAVAPQ